MSRAATTLLAALSVAASAVVAIVHGAMTVTVIMVAALAAGCATWLSGAAPLQKK
jgi:hypothetical protein